MSSQESMHVPEFVATREWERGYRFNTGDVAIIGVDENGASGPQAFIDGADANGQPYSAEEMAQVIDEQAVPMIGESYRRLVVVRFEEFDHQESNGFHDQLTSRLEGSYCEVVGQFKVDRDREIYQGYMDQQWNSPGRRWTTLGRVPDVDTEMESAGYSAPAANKHEFLARYTPARQPGFQALDAEGDTRFLDMAASPRTRVDFARRALTVAADPAYGDHERMRARQTVAHVVNIQPHARDAVAFDAAGDRQKREELVNIYRLTPPTQRVAVASAAASAYIAGGKSIHAAETILSQPEALNNPEHGRLPMLLKAAATQGHLSPQQMQNHLGTGLETGLEEAEQEFTADADARLADYRAEVAKNPEPTPQPYHSDGGWAWYAQMLSESPTTEPSPSASPEVG